MRQVREASQTRACTAACSMSWAPLWSRPILPHRTLREASGNDMLGALTTVVAEAGAPVTQRCR
ncbi:hypothetical protein [Nonomuraea aurantiaca]|uniref:hypothetical protein n=1 Tax=Nonomuraea aurantiaca TaxID=2878562 RepID=UPI001CD9A227|nr:hypothetical protein [Nonomuraea aurantiaca]MCA2222177.1 hypothetical protein [Nonomuraea aurantiaca]